MPRAILASGGELFVLLAGRPAGERPGAETYSETLSRLEAAMAEAKDGFSFAGFPEKHRRGQYRAISAGVTHGGGSKVGLVQPGVGVC